MLKAYWDSLGLCEIRPQTSNSKYRLGTLGADRFFCDLA